MIGDRPQPSTKAARVAQLVYLLERFQEDILTQILCPVVVTHPCVRNAQDMLVVPAGQFSKRFPVTTLGAANQISDGCVLEGRGS